MEIRLRSVSGRVPKYGTAGSSGFDLPAYLPNGPITLEPGQRQLVPTGVFLELPAGYEAQVRARSGLAINHGIGLVNGIGTVDADYRGELLVPLINWGQEPFSIADGDRIAQVVICRFEQVSFALVSQLEDTERGAGGFGHTGVKSQ